MTTAAPPSDLGSTVSGLLDLVVTVPDGCPEDLDRLAGLALRDNPRRAHLIVSRILGKHIPVPPDAVLDGGYRLGDAVREVLAAGGTDARDAFVIGYCETATGLGHAVAERIGATYLHTTRRPDPDLPVVVRFEEEHSHAVAHLVQPAPGITLAGDGPLVLVDDELTTGRTTLNTIEALQAIAPRREYVVAALLDARTPAARAAFVERAASLGVTVRVASLLSAHVTLPEDVLERAGAARERLPAPAPAPDGAGRVRVHEALWPVGVPVTARHGMTPTETAALVAAAAQVAEKLAGVIAETGPAAPRVLVLGTEELLHAPTHVAAHLSRLLPGATVRNQSTTRSPVHASDAPGYAIRRTVAFAAPDEPDRPTRVHNLVDPLEPAGADGWSALRHDHLVVVVDAPVAACAPMLEALAPYADHLHLVPLPEGRS